MGIPETGTARTQLYATLLQGAFELVGGDASGEPPREADLEKCGDILDELAALVALPPVGGQSYDHHRRIGVGARRRAWMVRRSGVPCDTEMRERICTMTAYSPPCLGWPLAPITRDPTFRAYVEELVDTWTREKSWPAPIKYEGRPISVTLDTLTKLDDPIDDGEIDGRQLVTLWAGLDKGQCAGLAEPIIQGRGPQRLLDRLARTGLARAGLKLRPPADPALAASLVEAAKTLAPRPLAFVASCFNARTTDAVAVVEAFCARLQPSSIAEVLAELPGHPFDAYAVLAAMQAAGLGRDIRVKRAIKKGRIVAAGNCTIGADVSFATIAVSGNLEITGKLDAPYDVVVGGVLRARSIHAEGSEGVLCVVGDTEAGSIKIEEHDFECLGTVTETKSKRSSKPKTKAKAKPKAKPKAKAKPKRTR